MFSPSPNFQFVPTLLCNFLRGLCQLTFILLVIVLTSSSCNKSVKIRLVATCHLQTCYNLSKQLAANLWITSFDNQLATSLLTTCNRLIVNKRYIQLARNRMAVNKLSQAMRTHPDIGLLMTSLLKDVKGLVAA